MGALIRGRYYKSVRVSELRIDDMLHRIQTNLNKPQYRTGEIFLYAPDQASRNNARTRADAIIKNVNDGADFSALAQQFSAAPSASAGGDLNWLSAGDMRPEIEDAVLKADKVPSILPPIESEGGIYVIALTGKREASDPSKSVIFGLEQVVSRGDGASSKLEALKAKAAAMRWHHQGAGRRRGRHAHADEGHRPDAGCACLPHAARKPQGRPSSSVDRPFGRR